MNGKKKTTNFCEKKSIKDLQRNSIPDAELDKK